MLSGIPKQENIFICREMNGRVGRDADVYGGMGFGIRNAEGEGILEFGDQWAWWGATHSSRRKTLS